MSLDSKLFEALPSVSGALNYLVHTGQKPVNYTFNPPPGIPYNSGSYETRVVPIRDSRQIPNAVSLDQNGFTLVHHRSAIRDFYDEDEVRRAYYPEVQRLLMQVIGAMKVVVFDHTVRKREPGKPPLSFGRPRGGGMRGPVGRVHNDFTLRSAPDRVRLELGAEAEELLQHRFAVINVWRPIRGPLLDAPLAVCDGSSVSGSDLVPTDLVYRNRTGETYSLTFNSSHRWFYFSAMREDEALLIKCYDSATDVGARFAPHSAFEDPTAPPDASPRESIEVRSFVFYPN